MKRIIVALTVGIFFASFTNISAQEDFLMTDDAPAFRLQSRFIGSVEFCIAPSYTINESVLSPFTFNIKGGYKFRYTSLTGILGIEYLNDENFIPLGIEVRQNFSNNKWVPFAYTQAGYSLHLKRNIHSRYFTANYAQYEPSFYLRAGLGYGMATTLSEFYVSLGYLYHQLEEIVVEQTGEVRTDLTMHGLAVSVGFVF
jgi:hypothetical protein